MFSLGNAHASMVLLSLTHILEKLFSSMFSLGNAHASMVLLSLTHILFLLLIVYVRGPATKKLKQGVSSGAKL